MRVQHFKIRNQLILLKIIYKWKTNPLAKSPPPIHQLIAQKKCLILSALKANGLWDGTMAAKTFLA
jgi:hypothetical protein